MPEETRKDEESGVESHEKSHERVMWLLRDAVWSARCEHYFETAGCDGPDGCEQCTDQVVLAVLGTAVRRMDVDVLSDLAKTIAEACDLTPEVKGAMLYKHAEDEVRAALLSALTGAGRMDA